MRNVKRICDSYVFSGHLVKICDKSSQVPDKNGELQKRSNAASINII